MAYPFRWIAVLPLTAMNLARKQVSDAVDLSRLILEPTQQRLPNPLAEALSQGIDLWDCGSTDEAVAPLKRAMQAAEQLAFL